MKKLPFPVLATGALVAFSAPWLRAEPVINEIMFRPGTGYPEDTALEFIEIHNPGADTVDLSGWAFTNGVDFVFPAGTILGPGEYLVVAAEVEAFLAAQPGVPVVAGPWESGTRLSNRGERITLSMPNAESGEFETVDSVRYADEGDWASRVRDGLGGWSWESGADGGGRSLERRNPLLDSDSGANFGESSDAGGTPGGQNSVFATDIAPVITAVKHSPAVPTSGDEVTVSCEVADELGDGSASVTLFYRDASDPTPGPFLSAAMAVGFGSSYSATLPAMPDKTIVEFYVSASDGGLVRTWPAPTSEGQNANCQYQVDDEVVPGTAPTYRLVLTAAENAAFEATDARSNRLFNVTFIAERGADPTIRYRAAMRTRGNSSRNYAQRPLRISFPGDDEWDGVTDFALNPKFGWCQYIGMRALQAGGAGGHDATPVILRRNGVAYEVAGDNGTHGRWARIEIIDGDYLDNHWPNAVNAQVYRAEGGGGGGGPGGGSGNAWVSTGAAPANPDTNWNGWSKQNGKGANDWSDVMNFSAVWQSTAAAHFTGAQAGNVSSGNWDGTPFTDAEVAVLEEVADLEHMARWMAVMTIIQSTEGSIANGGSSDYAAAWVEDELGRKRLNLVPHDLDSVLGKGDEARGATATSIFEMTEGGFEPLLPLFGTRNQSGNAAFRDRYLTELRRLYGSVFDADTSVNAYPPFYAFIDEHLSDWLPDNVRDDLKSFATQRQAYLMAQVGAAKIIPEPDSVATFTSAFAGVLRINEVLASNTSAHAVGGEFPDAIELHNAGATDLDIGGMALTDQVTVPRKFVFPGGTVIPAGGFLVVLAENGSAALPGVVTGFELDAGGDSVRFYDTEANGGALLDEVVFGVQVTDLSIARSPSAPDVWALASPTMGATNSAPQALGDVGDVRVNEWLANSKFRVDADFAELFNPGAFPVALAGATLTDDVAVYPGRTAFAPLSFLGAGGILALDSGDLGFRLDANFGYVTLAGANGDLIDQVAVTSHFADTSSGRSPDGSDAVAAYALPTPGLSNSTDGSGMVALIESLRITEIMAEPAGGSVYEFLELQNIGGETLDLGGVRFTDGIDYTFAEGAVLGPGEFVVVCADRDAFLERYPEDGAALADGAFIGRLDNSGEPIALTLPKPWDVHILSFRFDPDWYEATASAGRSLVTVDQVVTLPGDWGDPSTWSPSADGLGTPGSDAPPTITSAAVAVGVLGDPFAYQITATKVPTAFGASGLPPGLAIDGVTGLISGAASEAGTFAGTVTAENPAGTVSMALTITVAESGPLDHFDWEVEPAAAEAGSPFELRLSARDSAGRLVVTYSGAVSLSAASGATHTGSPVVITEITDGAQDRFELQNISGEVVDTSDWYVRINDSSASINNVHATQASLPASLEPGGLVLIAEQGGGPGGGGGGGTSWGGPINWSSSGTSLGWIMLLDGSDTVRDFVVWGWSEAELSGLDAVVNGVSHGAADVWSGAPLVVGARGGNNSWARTGTEDTDGPTDWAWTNGSTLGATNPETSLPWITTTPVPIEPDTMVFVAGEAAAPVTIGEAATDVRITADDGAGHRTSTQLFDVGSAPVVSDRDEDGMPDAWEEQNGLDPDSGADAELDSDRDGFSNLAEFLAGSDPFDPRSNHRILSAAYDSASGELTLEIQAMEGRGYLIETSPDLREWDFQVWMADSTGTVALVVPGGAGRTLFARVTPLGP